MVLATLADTTNNNRCMAVVNDYLLCSISLFLKEHSESAMATAYADLVSLVQTIEHLQQHPHPPVSLDRQQVLSLQESVAALQEFLELYSHRLSQEYEDGLVVRIADVAHAAEDKVIADMDLIRNEVIEIRERMATVQDRQQRRNSNPAGSFMSSSTLQGHKQAMDEFSGETKSWDLFRKIVFGEEGGCPPELEEIGKTIAKNCKGLPLSVIVIRGLLAKSGKARDYWEYIAENLSSIVNLEENCVRILYMSYKELPIHLKLCFLYMGVYPEDRRIRASRLRKLWVAEGLLKPISDPPIATGDEFVLPNLQKMCNIINLKFSEQVVKRIPNIKKLTLNYHHHYYDADDDLSSPQYCFENLGCLQKLEYLDCRFLGNVRRRYLVKGLSMLHSLNKLSLENSHLQWEDITTKIGSLPLLQVLKLGYHSVTGPMWETFEGQFSCMRFLQINNIHDLEYWTVVESSHFPCLKRLGLVGLSKLKEIPSSFGEIQTLELIELTFCSDSAVISAKETADQQEEFGNQDFRVQVYIHGGSITLN
ncbi:UNVERIFIED_CONTAM: putative late blight resistance proteinR1C-3 [Sesamum calycinum]|uniref:Late blight resistance proteinR1C-3 n=1 Tax=Sesamum calycinum TaxID=2727403 RepID=A0AAW2R023_9LAMI